MVQQRSLSSLATLWNNPELLADLLDYFRQQGFKVTTDEYALAQDLVLALIARGEDVSDVRRLKTYLAPVLCTNVREQNAFAAHFDRWVTRASWAPKNCLQPPPDRELELAGDRWDRWRWIMLGIAASLAVAILLLVLYSARAGPGFGNRGPVKDIATTGNPPNPTPSASLVSLGVLLDIGLAVLLTLLAWSIWWYFSTRLFLKRRLSGEVPDLISVTVTGGTEEWLDLRLLRQAARELRQRHPSSFPELAIPQTLEQTVRNNGQFTPVFGTRFIASEYLVFIDRKGFRDHTACYIDRIVDRLEIDEVCIRRYYFDHDLRVLAPLDKNDPPTILNDLAARYDHFRVLVFSDCAGFFSPISGELENWTEPLWRWPHVALLTSKPRNTWGYQEAVLAERAWLLPATGESIEIFARRVKGLRSVYRDEEPESCPFPAELAERPNRWLERDAPPPDLVKDILESVRRFLGEEGYFWLAACAAYPEIHFNLTLYLGTNLRSATGERLFSHQRASALFRLPWLRYANIPDWLRTYLIKALSKEQNRQIREALNRLWLSVTAGSTTAINLEIARKHPHALANLGRRIFQQLARGSRRDSPLRDYVFASLMLGRDLDPLLVRVPTMWYKLLITPQEALTISSMQREVNRFTALFLSSGIGALLFMYFPGKKLWIAALVIVFCYWFSRFLDLSSTPMSNREYSVG